MDRRCLGCAGNRNGAGLIAECDGSTRINDSVRDFLEFSAKQPAHVETARRRFRVPTRSQSGTSASEQKDN